VACEKPIKAYRPPEGGRITFNPGGIGKPYNILLPCGTCILCREEQARQQAIRIVHEAAMQEENAFITLTYDDAHLPAHNSLNYDDLRNFWKRLRKYLWKRHQKRVRHYSVGEYGDKTKRPHYHACVFGESFIEGREIIRTSPNLLWTSPVLQYCWQKGFVSVGTLNFETARYTASYMQKKLAKNQKYVRVNEETGELVPLEQPRAIMSDNLGKRWFHKWMQQVIQHDHVVINGIPQKPPKAYDKYLLEISKSVSEEIKEVRRQKAEERPREDARARAEAARARAKSKNNTL
jgi:hypothetical protein